MRINQDGTCGVPGLSERPVNNVDDVLKCIGVTWMYGDWGDHVGRSKLQLQDGSSSVEDDR